MTTYNFGDIVLVGFPHTDLQDISKRPALVLYDSGDRDILIARITTQEYTAKTDYKIIEWKKCGRCGFYCRRQKAHRADNR